MTEDRYDWKAFCDWDYEGEQEAIDAGEEPTEAWLEEKAKCEIRAMRACEALQRWL